jgi:hypothetical protein
MYGKGKVTTHPMDAKGFMTEVKKDPLVIPARFHAALEQLKQDPHVSVDHIAAIGYCFGGSVVLGEARSGEYVNEDAHEALVTRGLFKAVRDRKGTAKAASKNGGEGPLLGGLLVPTCSCRLARHHEGSRQTARSTAAVESASGKVSISATD